MRTLEARTRALAAVAALLLLAGMAIGCGSSTVVRHVEMVVEPTYPRWVTGYVEEHWTGWPVWGARVLVETSWSDELYETWTDPDGYFEVYVGDYYDYEEVYFRVWRVDASGYYSYVPDEYWYSIDWRDDIDTGYYVLYPR